MNKHLDTSLKAQLLEGFIIFQITNTQTNGCGVTESGSLTVSSELKTTDY